MLIECPKCGAGFQVPERLLRDRSRPMRCGQCGTLFPMPEPPAPEPEPVAFRAPEPPPPAPVVAEPRQAPAPPAEEPRTEPPAAGD
ncbi:MAG: zinc-ribbon domain-containing protein, partial [Alphaproteobacteria bacterium]